MKLTLIVKKGKNGYLIGRLKELPAVFTQGSDMQELRENIRDAPEMYLEDVREDYKPDTGITEEEESVFV